MKDQSFTDFRCIIVDNGSTDGSLETLPKLDKRFEILKLGENTGFAKASNIGVAHCDSKWVAMLNPDAFARPDWLEKLLAATSLAPNVTMVGSTQIMALEPDIYDGLGDCYHISGLAWRSGFGHKVEPFQTCEVFGPCGAGALYHRETYHRLGGFDEDFFCYHEDVDLAYRMRLAGGICTQSSTAIIDHVSSAISGRHSDFATYHGTRNRLWTLYKNTPTLLWPLVLPLHILLTLLLLFRSLLRPATLLPTLRGLKDGLFGLGKMRSKRRHIQKNIKQISTSQLLKAFAWSPVKALTRGVHHRPISGKRPT